MTKINAPNLDTGTGTKQVNARKIPAYYDPENYVPTAVDDESVAMLSAHLRGIDLKLGSLISISYTDQLFLSDGIVTEYTLTNPFDSGNKIDIWFNGILKEENNDWKRDAGPNQIYAVDDVGTKEALPDEIYVRARIYDNGFGNTDQSFVDPDATTVFLSNPISAESILDVYINGWLAEEDKDYRRESNNDSIVKINDIQTSELFPNDCRVLVRILNAPKIDEYFSGGVASVDVAQTFEDATKIDVYINGRLGREGFDWSRDSGANSITIVDGVSDTDTDTRILVRIWV